MRVRSGIIASPRYKHDCDRCVYICGHWGNSGEGKPGIEDVYLCIGGKSGRGSLVHRRSDEPSDYTSTPFSLEGELDPTRERLAFRHVRIIEQALGLAQSICRAYEEAPDERNGDGDLTKGDIEHMLDAIDPFLPWHLPGHDLGVTEEEIRSVDWHFDTHIGERWPVIYTPHEHTPAPE